MSAPTLQAAVAEHDARMEAAGAHDDGRLIRARAIRGVAEVDLPPRGARERRTDRRARAHGWGHAGQGAQALRRTKGRSAILLPLPLPQCAVLSRPSRPPPPFPQHLSPPEVRMAHVCEPPALTARAV